MLALWGLWGWASYAPKYSPEVPRHRLGSSLAVFLEELVKLLAVCCDVFLLLEVVLLRLLALLL